jgi:hypothetical protein
MDEISRILEKYLGNPIDWYSKKVPKKNILQNIINELKAIDSVSEQFYKQLVISDIFILLQKYDKALEYCPEPTINQQWKLLSNRRLNLLIINNKDISSTEALSLFPKNLTKYGINYLENIACIIDEKIVEKQIDKGILQKAIEGRTISKDNKIVIFNGTLFSKEVHTSIMWFEFTESLYLKEIISDLSRSAENILREESGIPAVGQAWISETILFNQIKESFPQLKIEQHAMPKWLGRQHLDIFIPEKKIAIEYQGEQHNVPIEYFGGREAFEEQVKRDKRKRSKCKRNGIMIIYVEKGYSLSKLVEEINNVD